MRKRIRSRALATALGSVGLLGACDDDDVVGAEDRQVFVAELDPLNNSGVDGTATFVMDEDGRFIAEVDAVGLDMVLHPQHIHAKAECPTMALDRANDGDDILDVVEAVPAYGKILVPLDSRLADLAPGLAGGDFPQGSVINYIEAVRLETLVTALRNFQAPNSAFTGLAQGEELNPAQRVVVLHGTSRSLPASVQSIGDLPAQATLPVACGTIEPLAR